MRSCSSREAFASDLNQLLSRSTGTSRVAELRDASFYELIVHEMDQVGWGILAGVSSTLDTLELQVKEAAGRDHTLTLQIPEDYPRSPPIAQASLPAAFELRWPSHADNGASSYCIAAAIAQFQAALTQYQLLWDMLDDLDSHTWVHGHLEPTLPRLFCTVKIGS